MPNTQSPQQSQPQPSTPKKKSSWWKWLLGGCGVLLILFIIAVAGCSMLGNKAVDKAANEIGNLNTETSEADATQPTNEVNEEPKDEPKEEPTPEPEEQWEEVINISSSADKQTDTFSLEGGKQKIIYNTTGGDMTMCYIYVMNEGTSLDQEGGFPEVSVMGSESNETMMRKDKGNYYLDMNVVNGNCDVTIQELR